MNFLGSWEIYLIKFYYRVINTLSLRFCTNARKKNFEYYVRRLTFFIYFFTIYVWFLISLRMSSLIFAKIEGDIVRYFEDSARIAQKTFKIF